MGHQSTIANADELLPMGSSAVRHLPLGSELDPLASDQPHDRKIITTARRLNRLAIVAADAGARFSRDSLTQDAAAWMLAPAALFHGACPLEACQDRGAFIRATLLHNLSFGLDCDAEEMDALIGDSDDASAATVGSLPLPTPSGGSRLFTCTIEGRIGTAGRSVQAFCAMVAPDAGVVRRRLQLRYGQALGNAALVQEGFDKDDAIARTLLSDALRRMLVDVAGDPGGDICWDLDLQVEQRFAA